MVCLTVEAAISNFSGVVWTGHQSLFAVFVLKEKIRSVAELRVRNLAEICDKFKTTLITEI